MPFDPDFLIIGSGIDVTHDVFTWTLNEHDDDTSTLSFSVQNQNFDYDYAFNINDQASIVFGYPGNMSPSVNMTIKEIEPAYAISQHTIRVTAYCDVEKLDGDTMRGHFNRGVDTKTAIENTLKAAVPGVTPNVNITPPTMQQDFRHPVAGQTPYQSISFQLNMSQDPLAPSAPDVDKSLYASGLMGNFGGWDGTANAGGYIPSIETANLDKRNTSQDQSIDAKVDKSKKDPRNIVDNNRAKNKTDQAHSQAVTAQMELLGYPQLRANFCVMVLNVGKGSGLWFVKGVRHYWQVDSGFSTTASLVRGDNTKQQDGGMCNAPRPMVIHSEIYNQQPTIYCGPRKTEAPCQATFLWGDGNFLKSFSCHENGTKNKKGAGTDVKGKLRDKKSTASTRSGIQLSDQRANSSPSGGQTPGAGAGRSR